MKTCIILNLTLSLILFYSVSASEYKDVSNNNDLGVIINQETERLFEDISNDFGKENLNLNAKICDCGRNSIDCKIEDGRKICTCKPGYSIGRNDICVETCSENRTCANGGSCLQHVCICLPGTSGPFCETVDDCERKVLCKLNEATRCEYNIEKQKAECACRVMEYRFDSVSRTCRNCICSPGYSSDFKYFSNCEYHEGKKVCTCNKGYAYKANEEHCDDCECGENAKWCEFDRSSKKVCVCKDGYYEGPYNGYNNDCSECKCGQHGKCDYVSSWGRPRATFCKCDAGYEEYNATCFECKCGKYGSCIFDNDGKQVECECKDGYKEKLGKCEICYCGDNATCSFEGQRKICNCSEGYHDVNGFCEDINECEHSACDSSSICINVPGSYKCLCAEGYAKKTYTNASFVTYDVCEDIDECKNPNNCFDSEHDCINTRGSFACVCKPGFVSRGGTGIHIFCEKTTDGSIYTVVTVAVFTVLVILLGFYVCTNRRSHI